MLFTDIRSCPYYHFFSTVTFGFPAVRNSSEPLGRDRPADDEIFLHCVFFLDVVFFLFTQSGIFWDKRGMIFLVFFISKG